MRARSGTRGRAGKMHHKEEAGMTLIVKGVTRLTLGFILLYGIFLGLNGHGAIGGGFVGGVIIALSLVHVMLAFGKKVALKRLHSYALRVLVCVAGLAFAVVALFGDARWKEAVIPLCEMALVGFGIFAIFIALVLLSKMDRDAE